MPPRHTIPSRASHDAIIAIGAVLLSLTLTLVATYLPYTGRVALTIALIVAPVAVVLSWVSMAARAQCEIPKPKLPVFALVLSIAFAIVLACVVLFFWSLGQMH